jgi:UDP-galactopyranose mutase
MNILVVGAGFAGATVARELAEAGHLVTVIDKRDHVAGNAFDYTNEHDIRVHAYGPHLFHTNNEEVWNYLGRFTEWVPYFHKVKALLADGRYVTLPINRETRKIVGEENLVETFIRPYSEKMWGMKLEQLDPAVLARVPMRDDDNELYFPNDKYQGMPKAGYTDLIEKMLEHENIIVQLGVEFDKSLESSYDHVFNSMPIDVYYDFEFGELPYRSIKFETEHLPAECAQPATVINYTHTAPRTRVTEWKQIPCHGENDDVTTVTYETPCDYRDNNMERYYPVKDIDGKNRATYAKYAALKNPKVTFIGRCGQYQYYDMWICVANSRKIAQDFIKGENK